MCSPYLGIFYLQYAAFVFQAQAQDIVPTIGFSIEKFKTSR